MVEADQARQIDVGRHSAAVPLSSSLGMAFPSDLFSNDEGTLFFVKVILPVPPWRVDDLVLITFAAFRKHVVRELFLLKVAVGRIKCLKVYPSTTTNDANDNAEFFLDAEIEMVHTVDELQALDQQLKEDKKAFQVKVRNALIALTRRLLKYSAHRIYWTMQKDLSAKNWLPNFIFIFPKKKKKKSPFFSKYIDTCTN